MADRRTWIAFIATTLLCVAGLVIRLPYAFSMPQFSAEEGAIFFAQAYDDGWRSMVGTANGYFHSVPRLIANLTVSLGVPVVAIPAVFVYLCLPIYAVLWYLIFARLSLPLAARSSIALVTVLVPVGNEVFMNQTNLQWFIALIPIVIAAGRRPVSRVERVLDLVIVALCFTTGPYVLYVAPLVFVVAVAKGEVAERRAFLVVGGIAAAICAGSLLAFGGISRVGDSAGSGAYGFAQLTAWTYFYPLFTLLIGALSRPAIVLLALSVPPLLVWFGRTVVRSGDVFAMLALGASVLSFASNLASYWRNPMLPSPYFFAVRIFYLPMVLQLWACIASVRWERRTVVLTGVAVAWCLVLLPLTDGTRDGPAPVPDLRWADYAERIERGEAVSAPVLPAGWGTLELEAKPPG